MCWMILLNSNFKNKKQWESTVQQLLGHVLGYLNMPFIRLYFNDCKESREVGPHFLISLEKKVYRSTNQGNWGAIYRFHASTIRTK